MKDNSSLNELAEAVAASLQKGFTKEPPPIRSAVWAHTVTVARWIAVFPASIAAYFAVFIVLGFLMGVSGDFLESTNLHALWINFLAGGAFVVVGSLTAPVGRSIVSVVLATLLCSTLVAASVALAGRIQQPIWNLLLCASNAAGSIAGSVTVFQQYKESA